MFSLRFFNKIKINCQVLRVGTTNFDSKTGGDIANLLSVDTSRIETAIHYLPYIAIGWFNTHKILLVLTNDSTFLCQKGPIQIVVVVVIILSEIGVTFLTGLFLLLAILPIKAILAKIYNKFRLKNCQISDTRISILTEILSSIKIIKMYCWEMPFTAKATQARKFVAFNSLNIFLLRFL